jgi:hypothetical protein
VITRGLGTIKILATGEQNYRNFFQWFLIRCLPPLMTDPVWAGEWNHVLELFERRFFGVYLAAALFTPTF